MQLSAPPVACGEGGVNCARQFAGHTKGRVLNPCRFQNVQSETCTSAVTRRGTFESRPFISPVSLSLAAVNKGLKSPNVFSILLLSMLCWLN